MANQPVPDTIGLYVRGTLLGQQVENTFYYNYIAVPDEAQLQSFADDVADHWDTNGIGNLPNGWTGREVYVRDLAAPITVQATSLGILGSVGIRSGDTMPSFVTLAIARQSGLTGRSSRGRIFWMGLAESDVAVNVVSGALATSIIDFLEDQDAIAVTAGFTPVVVSRFQNNVELTVPQTYPVAGWFARDLNVDTRRSRKIGYGA